MIQTSAPAKLILFGEHAVVYGQPAIAVPVSSLRATAIVHPDAPNSGLRVNAVNLNQLLSVNNVSEQPENALILMVRLALQALASTPPDAVIEIRSTIPIAGGLGSGAAVSTCLARAIAAAVGRSFEPEQLNELVYVVEKLHHGTPSGIDNTVIVYEQPVYFVRNQPIEILPITQSFTLVIADTGVAVPTHIPVSDVRRLLEANPERIQPILDAIGQISRAAKTAIIFGDIALLGSLLTQNHHYLQQLTVSSPELDRLVVAALRAGALGAKLSGGGRGGNMFALVSPDKLEKVKQALLDTGAVRVFSSTIA